MTSHYEPLSPVAVEQKMRATVNKLAETQIALAAARDVEVEAEIAYKQAKFGAMLSDDAPRVARGGATTAERDAWVDRKCFEQYAAHKRAEATRQKAEDLLRITRDQGVLVASLAKSVDSAYRMAGVSA